MESYKGGDLRHNFRRLMMLEFKTSEFSFVYQEGEKATFDHDGIKSCLLFCINGKTMKSETMNHVMAKQFFRYAVNLYFMEDEDEFIFKFAVDFLPNIRKYMTEEDFLRAYYKR